MSDTATSFSEPLGVGNIIGESFGIFFKRIVPILIIGTVITLVSNLVNLAIFGSDFMTGAYANDPEFLNNLGTFYAQIAISSLIGMVFVAIMYGSFTLLAYDAKLAKSSRIGTYVSAATRNLLPIAILSIVWFILVYIGLAFFIVPGLWLIAVFSVLVPAIVVERAGFGAMGRSASLTKGYRWPIVGLWLVFIIISVIVFGIIGAIAGGVGIALAGPDAVAGGFGTVGTLVFLLITSVLSALMYGLLSIPGALVYARLREIKEGISVDSMADVFS